MAVVERERRGHGPNGAPAPSKNAICIRCDGPRNRRGAMCADCHTAVRAAISAYARPIFDARRKEAEHDRARQAAAWDQMLTASRSKA